VSALPESFLVDREGRIRHRVIGYFAEPALRAAVADAGDVYNVAFTIPIPRGPS
jgi:hypothetical protein